MQKAFGVGGTWGGLGIFTKQHVRILMMFRNWPSWVMAFLELYTQWNICAFDFTTSAPAITSPFLYSLHSGYLESFYYDHPPDVVHSTSVRKRKGKEFEHASSKPSGGEKPNTDVLYFPSSVDGEGKDVHTATHLQCYLFIHYDVLHTVVPIQWRRRKAESGRAPWDWQYTLAV